MKNFKDKTIVITGAGSGMGRAYALEFAKLNARIAITDYDEAGLNETVKQLESLPHKGICSQAFDISNKEIVDQFARRVKDELGPAHVMINNAGIGGGGKPVWNIDAEQYTQTLNVNFFGVVYGTQAFLPQLIQNNEGAIINVSSIFGLVGTPNASDYCASKFAVRGFTESLMVELEDSPISVHLLHPGGIKTNIAMNTDGGEEFTAKYLKTPPVAVVREVIKAIQTGKQRIVCGHQSKPVALLSWAIPLRWRNKYLHNEMKDLFDPEDYQLISKF
ncbi:short-chain dehydrogenase [Oleiphilus sp. HI0125]|uniref:SDR family NAD(P)-dependent oxidoreductase n=1 Tax=Oleiphilus sp. HI0125 TaxID=1822266 RepID=UPI0007C22755|nr:SDR family oxidoreductase [Oleiphilus sp. HI0125]KZZ63399.1 short-chain dehydrogenase [Oleiphilus sp. HI0125]